MPDVPHAGQLALLLAAIAVFAVGGVLSVAKVTTEPNAWRIPARSCVYAGILLGISVVIWHSVVRRSWIPLENNFEALVWLAVLLALFLAYVQATRPLRAMDWFVIPIIIALLIGAVVFGRTKPHRYVGTTWSWVHLLTAFGGAAALAIAGVAGAMYLVVNHRLRTKQTAPGVSFGSLERLERLMFFAATLGFSLLTIGLLTGLVLAIEGRNLPGREWYAEPKVLLTFIAWLVYAMVLHAPINPSFRGRRAALLSVIGFVLMVGTLVAVQLMPISK